MAEMWEKRHRIVERMDWGSEAKTVVKFRSMAMISKQELIEYLNKYNAKPKMKAKAVKELVKRGVKLVWN